MKNTLVKILKIDIILQSIFWAVASLYLELQNYSYIIVSLTMVNAFLFAVSIYLIKKNKTIINIFIFLFILGNAILTLTLTDQFGIFDFIILFFNIIALFCLALLLIQKNKF